MIAYVECGVCGRRLQFDTGAPINPEIYGWSETERGDMSIDALYSGPLVQKEKIAVCPDCQRKHAEIVEMFDPFARISRKGGSV